MQTHEQLQARLSDPLAIGIVVQDSELGIGPERSSHITELIFALFVELGTEAFPIFPTCQHV